MVCPLCVKSFALARVRLATFDLTLGLAVVLLLLGFTVLPISGFCMLVDFDLFRSESFYFPMLLLVPPLLNCSSFGRISLSFTLFSPASPIILLYSVVYHMWCLAFADSTQLVVFSTACSPPIYLCFRLQVLLGCS